MKNFLKAFSALTMVIFIITASIIPSFAAGDLTLNGVKSVKKDDVVTYTLKLADCDVPIVGFQMYIKYDKEYLEMVENSLAFPELSGSVIHNGSNQENSDDGIIFNYVNVQTPDDFSAEKVFATVDFKVLKGGETDITFFVGDLYGEDMTYMKSYTFTYDLSVNNKLVIEGEAPVLITDQEFLNENQGQFVNYVDGKGEANGSGENATRETIMGVTTAPPTNVQKGTESGNSFDLTTIIVLIAVVLIVLVIVVLVIVRNAMNRSKKQEENASLKAETTEKTEE